MIFEQDNDTGYNTDSCRHHRMFSFAILNILGYLCNCALFFVAKIHIVSIKFQVYDD